MRREKQRAIAQVASELFARQGYEPTTMADVAAAAGVAVGSLYRHYASKAELLEGVRELAQGEFLSAMQAPHIHVGRYQARIRPMMQALFDTALEQATLARSLGSTPLSGEAQAQREGAQQMVGAIRAFLEEAVAAGEFRPMDTEAVAVLAFGAVGAALHRCFEQGGGRDAERWVEALTEMFTAWVAPHGRPAAAPGHKPRRKPGR